MGHPWFGSKATSGLCQALIALMPPHAVYIETHLGGGAVMRRKPAALRNIGIDLDGRALSGFECGYPVERVNADCHGYLADFAFDGSELVYSDPPYLRGARKSSRRYRHDYEDADHAALLELLAGLPCAVMVSGYPSALYDGLLRGWRSVSLQVMNQAGVVTEKVWFNFAPDRVHWAALAAVKRLAHQLDRLRACFAGMPDPRRGRNRRYAMADIGMAALSVFLMQSPSFLAHQRALAAGRTRSNAHTLFGLARIPCDNHIRQLLDGVPTTHFDGAVTYRGAFVTSLDVDRDNVAELADCARARWKIENETFNVLKHHGYHLEHNFGHGKDTLAAVLVVLNLLAFALHTACELAEAQWQQARQRLGTRRRLFEHLRTVTEYQVFPSWNALMVLLATGGPAAQPP